jgi:hypothetical protein
MINFKYIIFFSVLSLFMFSGFSKAQSSSDSLVGVWQDDRIVASGWSNTFLFFKDGTFKFFFNQMDCAKRTVSCSGMWKVNEDELNLTIQRKNVIEGGRLVLSDGSCGTDSMIVDGVEKAVNLETPEEIIYSVSEIYTDNQDDISRIKIYIDAMPYWKFSDNPQEMLKEFE